MDVPMLRGNFYLYLHGPAPDTVQCRPPNGIPTRPTIAIALAPYTGTLAGRAHYRLYSDVPNPAAAVPATNAPTMSDTPPGTPPAPVPQDEMAICLVHELNPPLAIIGLFAANALRDLRHGEAEAALQRLKGIVIQVDRAAGIIEKLRRFARAGQPGAPPAPVSLDEAVANALPLIRGALA
jgi:hypothetical protein